MILRYSLLQRYIAEHFLLLVLVSSHPSLYLILHKIQVSFSATSAAVPFPICAGIEEVLPKAISQSLCHIIPGNDLPTGAGWSGGPRAKRGSGSKSDGIRLAAGVGGGRDGR